MCQRQIFDTHHHAGNSMASEEMQLARPQIKKLSFKVGIHLDLKKHNGDTVKTKTNKRKKPKPQTNA